MSERKTGIIKFFKEQGGFGFIESGLSSNIFFHVSECNSKTPKPGDKVSFDTKQSSKGLSAIGIQIVEMDVKEQEKTLQKRESILK